MWGQSTWGGVQEQEGLSSRDTLEGSWVPRARGLQACEQGGGWGAEAGGPLQRAGLRAGAVLRQFNKDSVLMYWRPDLRANLSRIVKSASLV